MKIGYARVSTRDQTLETQRDRLAAVGCEMVFEEKISGAKARRPQLETMLGQLRKTDVVVVTKLDRLARSTAELLRISESLIEKKAGLQSLDEPWADTTSPSGKMILTVFGGIAEFERHHLSLHQGIPTLMTSDRSNQPQIPNCSDRDLTEYPCRVSRGSRSSKSGVRTD